MQRELVLVKKWLDANKLLPLNTDKTNYVICHSSSASISCHSTIKIVKKHIKRVKLVKFLCVLLGKQLTWKYHLSELSKNQLGCVECFQNKEFSPIRCFNLPILCIVPVLLTVWSYCLG